MCKILCDTDMKLTECTVDEEQVKAIAVEVAVARREAEIVSIVLCVADVISLTHIICQLLIECE